MGSRYYHCPAHMANADDVGFEPKLYKPQHPDIGEPVRVFARVRNPECHGKGKEVINIEEGRTLRLRRPSSAHGYEYYPLTHVFNRKSSQKEVFEYSCLPLVQGLFEGNSGLFLSYGKENGGKTHTMLGSNLSFNTKDKGTGLIPRVIDSVFGNMRYFQVDRLVFKYNAHNGFEFEMKDFYKEAEKQCPWTSLRVGSVDVKPENQLQNHIMPESFVNWSHCNNHDNEWADCTYKEQPDFDQQLKLIVDLDYAYSVFVSCCEIYNEKVFDLLDGPLLLDARVANRPERSSVKKRIDIDGQHFNYVKRLTTVEVKSAMSARTIVQKAQNHKHHGLSYDLFSNNLSSSFGP